MSASATMAKMNQAIYSKENANLNVEMDDLKKLRAAIVDVTQIMDQVNTRYNQGDYPAVLSNHELCMREILDTIRLSQGAKTKANQIMTAVRMPVKVIFY